MNRKQPNILALALASIFGGAAFEQESKYLKDNPPTAPVKKKTRKSKSILGRTYLFITPRDSYGVTYEWNDGRIIRTSERVSKLSRSERRRIWAKR